jgi:hypothetical protein
MLTEGDGINDKIMYGLFKSVDKTVEMEMES